LITPELTDTDASVSDEVCTFTPTAPAVVEPIWKPDMVTTKFMGGIAAEAVAMTTWVDLVEPQYPDSAATLLEPARMADGVTEGAKKPRG
jgi:hypothetical protein